MKDWLKSAIEKNNQHTKVLKLMDKKPEIEIDDEERQYRVNTNF